MVFVVAVSVVDAQVYTWRDNDGVLVASDTPPPSDSPQPRVAAWPARTGATKPIVPHDIDELVLREAARQAIRPELVRAVIKVESAFNPLARSHKGAMGLMQLMPGTAADLQVSNPYDPAQNIQGGVRYLRQLLDRFDGNEELALATYNAGPAAVARYGNQVPPFEETQNYLRKLRQTITLSDRRSVPVTGRHTIYRTYDVINGHRVPTYSDVPRPTRGPDPTPQSGRQ